MIDLRDRDSAIPNLVSIASMVALVGGLIGMIMLQVGHIGEDPGLHARTRAEATKLAEQTKAIDAKLAETNDFINSSTWSGQTQDINQSVVNRVNELIKKYGLKLNSMRPQRPNTVDDLDTLPYLVIVEGPYPQVLAFTRELDMPNSKLAMNLVQIGSSDTNTDKVTANIGVVAYLNPKPTIQTPSEGESQPKGQTLKKEDSTTRA